MSVRDLERCSRSRFGLLPDVADFVNDAVPRARPESLSPPPDYMEVHHPGFAERVWTWLLRAVQDPVQIRQDALGRDVITILGTFVIVRHKNGCLSARYWEVGKGLGDVRLQHVPPVEIGAQHGPWRTNWTMKITNAIALHWLWWTGRPPEGMRMARAYAGWLLGALDCELARLKAYRTARRRIQEALGLDPAVLRLANRFPHGLAGPGRATLADYNIAVRHRHALHKLASDAPHLHGLYGVLAQAPWFRRRGEPLQRMRQHLQDAGLGTAAWRIVLNASPRLWLLVNEFYRDLAEDTVIDFLRCLELIGCPERPDFVRLQPVFSAYGGPAEQYWHYAKAMAPQAAVWRHVLRVCPAGALSEPTLADLRRIADWIRAEDVRTLARAQRQGGWRWLTARSRRWEELRQQQLRLPEVSWLVPFEPFKARNYTFKPLANAKEVWEDGQVMRHCVVDYLDRYRRGEAVVLSVTDSGWRRATLELVPSGLYWRINQFRGKANQDCSVALWKAARLVEAAATAQTLERCQAGRSVRSGSESLDDLIDHDSRFTGA